MASIRVGINTPFNCCRLCTIIFFDIKEKLVTLRYPFLWSR